MYRTYNFIENPDALSQAFPNMDLRASPRGDIGILPHLGFVAARTDHQVELLGLYVPLGPARQIDELPKELKPNLDPTRVPPAYQTYAHMARGTTHRFYNTKVAACGWPDRPLRQGVYALKLSLSLIQEIGPQTMLPKSAQGIRPQDIMMAVDHLRLSFNSKKLAIHMRETDEEAELRISRCGSDFPENMPPAFVSLLQPGTTVRLIGSVSRPDPSATSKG